MAEQPSDPNRLVTVATDLGLSAEPGTKAIGLIGNIGNHDALLALLNLAAKKS